MSATDLEVLLRDRALQAYKTRDVESLIRHAAAARLLGFEALAAKIIDAYVTIDNEQKGERREG